MYWAAVQPCAGDGQLVSDVRPVDRSAVHAWGAHPCSSTSTSTSLVVGAAAMCEASSGGCAGWEGTVCIVGSSAGDGGVP
jgi:hypothetical protein